MFIFYLISVVIFFFQGWVCMEGWSLFCPGCPEIKQTRLASSSQIAPVSSANPVLGLKASITARVWAGEMGQQLKTLAPPRCHLTNACNSSSRKSGVLFQPLLALGIHIHTCTFILTCSEIQAVTCMCNTHTWKIKNKDSF